MKKEFQKLTTAEKFEAVCSIETLRESLDRFINEESMNCIMEKIELLENVEYSIGTYSPSYLRLKGQWGEVYDFDAQHFIDDLDAVVSVFSCASDVEKQLAKCKKLSPYGGCGSNLFVYETKRLCEMYYETEIKPELEYAENLSYLVYCRTYKDEMEYVFERWLECNEGLDIVQDDNGEWAYIETIIHRAA